MKYYSPLTFFIFSCLVSFTPTAGSDQSLLDIPIFVTTVGYVPVFSETSSTLAGSFKQAQPFAPVVFADIKKSTSTSTSQSTLKASSINILKTSSTSTLKTSSTSTLKTSSTSTLKTSSTSTLKTSSTSTLKTSSTSSSKTSTTAVVISTPAPRNASYATVSVVNCSPSAPGRIVNLAISPQTNLGWGFSSLAKPAESPFDQNGRELSTILTLPGYAGWSWYVAGINGPSNAIFSQQDSFNKYTWGSTTVSLCESLIFYGGCPLSANLFQLVPWTVYLYLPSVVQVFNAHAGDVIVVNTSAKTQTGASMFCVQGTITLH